MNTTESEQLLTPLEIAQKALVCATDKKSKKNVTDGGYLWDLEKEITRDIIRYCEHLKASDSEQGKASGVRVNARVI